MAAQQREFRAKIRSTSSLEKIFRAMELIATSRIAKARAAVSHSTPYARAISRSVSAVATYSNVEHVLTTEKEQVRRAGVLVITSDRGMAGAYSSNVLRAGEELIERLRGEGKEITSYVAGRKAVAFYRFRNREIAQEWTGFSDSPNYENAREIGDRLVEDFLKDYEDGGIDEIHIVYTEFHSMVQQVPQIVRLLPLEVIEGDEAPPPDEVLPLYEFEPNAAEVLDALLPKYIDSRIFNALLQAAASELAARQRAMHAASDNAKELIRTYTRLANQARQAEITQEISEIVGGADALAGSS
jgi:F-type H+-transporting ATPase subunit gamma